MQQQTVSVIEFQNRFSTEEHCAEHLFKLRWPDGTFVPNVNIRRGLR